MAQLDEGGTDERAAVVNAAAGAPVAAGSIVLNHAVGGLNSAAVEIAARQGVRFVWLPTVSATGEHARVARADPRANVPVWVRFELELREAGTTPRAVPLLDEDGAPRPELLSVVAAHGLVLNTGHLSREEIVVDAAVEAIVVTNPEFPSHTLTAADQQRLAARGVLAQLVDDYELTSTAARRVAASPVRIKASATSGRRFSRRTGR